MSLYIERKDWEYRGFDSEEDAIEGNYLTVEDKPFLFVMAFDSCEKENGRILLTEKDAEDLMKKIQAIFGSRHENIP